jgi:predicted esterase YcpF (UPF0227 family)
MNEVKDRKILYLHGFGSSGASGTVGILRKAFMGTGTSDRVRVIAPDIPVDLKTALPFIKEIAERERPTLVVGTSMGAMYAQQLHGFERICVNPSLRFQRNITLSMLVCISG